METNSTVHHILSNLETNRLMTRATTAKMTFLRVNDVSPRNDGFLLVNSYLVEQIDSVWVGARTESTSKAHVQDILIKGNREMYRTPVP